jgi:5-formyltetrahydrofolate cyclo-ligase
MEEIQIVKSQIREEIAEKFAALSANEIAEKTKAIENRLFDFANFLESKIALLYVNNKHEVLTANILKRAYIYNKIVVLPVYNTENFEMELKKVDNLEKDQSVPEKGIMTGSYPDSPSPPVRLRLLLKRKSSHRSPSNLTTSMSILSSPKIV